MRSLYDVVAFFFFNDTATTEIYTLSLHDALPIFAFSFAASSIYCFNDIYDVEADKRHPVKCRRPIASGAVSIRSAYLLMGVMFVSSMTILQLLPHNNLQVTGVIFFYWCINLAYCMRLKRYAILDVCIVSFGFVLRIIAGGEATDIVLSRWIVLMTFLLSLFLSFAKRRDDVLRDRKSTRLNSSHAN